MRALEVLGLAEDGAHLVCHDSSTGEEFSVPADERLRAAARGDVTRLGQLEIELEPQLRPREIQMRIRAGASVAEVAAAAGTSATRIERFAYPVLMERSTMAELSARARPIGGAGPAARSIGDVVADTLGSRGHTGPIGWDAFKDTRGWVLAVRWKTGRSENVALFDLHPGPEGGTVTPRDEAATDLLDPAPKPLRTVRSMSTAGADPDAAPHIPDVQQEPEIPAQEQVSPAISHDEPKRAAEQLVADTVDDERSGAMPAPHLAEAIARTGTDHASAGSPRAHKKAAKPAMPSWDDVLLGSGLRQR
ncbi:MAG: septation protein SepH [Actinomycetota bacterium]|nr:septation protein SepH [Actinomycetota bacterium]